MLQLNTKARKDTKSSTREKGLQRKEEGAKRLKEKGPDEHRKPSGQLSFSSCVRTKEHANNVPDSFFAIFSAVSILV